MGKVLNLGYGEAATPTYNVRLAMEEASRCLLCEDAPCSRDCPAGTDPGKFIRSLRFRNIRGAVETIRKNNILGASCALVCPYDRLCEGACSRTGIDRPIQIGRLQAFAMQHEQAYGMRVLERAEPVNKRVLCVGAGPASLACAAKLSEHGIDVHIVDAHERAGGVLRYGITPSRLPESVVDQDIACVEALGVSFEQNRRISADELPVLRKEYDAIFVGVGLSEAKLLTTLPGADLAGTQAAIHFLKIARETEGKALASKLGRVVIIGGGDVAMDCASTSIQLGAESVRVVFMESMDKMPAGVAERDYVVSLGATLISGFVPTELKGKDSVQAVDFVSVNKDSHMSLAADLLIFAVGQRIADDYRDLRLEDGMFIAGDAVNGGRTVVEAVAEGKEAALSILKFLALA
ncbi:MAG: FAD-dependent oxidoreductase [Bradymonadia bacterium]|jgi:dihydropyrimidine dehydrogenase (NAD+) subunit PreT